MHLRPGWAEMQQGFGGCAASHSHRLASRLGFRVSNASDRASMLSHRVNSQQLEFHIAISPLIFYHDGNNSLSGGETQRLQITPRAHYADLMTKVTVCISR
jgi:hypothetical protein